MSEQKNRYILLPFLFLFSVLILFFYKTFLKGLLPFPGDLLISEYKPWSTYSFLGYNPGSYPSKKQYFDTIRQIYPWRTLVISQIKQGHLPLWNPYNFAGTPLLANVQSQVFYPLTLLYFLMDQKIAWTILVILQPFLATLFMYGYMRTIKTSVMGSLLAAVSYGFSLYVTVFLEYNTIGHVILWLPFLLWMVELIIQKKKIISLLGLTFGMITMLLAGHLQLSVSLYLFTLVYVAFRIVKNRNINQKQKKFLMIIFGSIFFLSLGIAAIQFLPTSELISLSARANHDPVDIVNRLLIQPKQLLMAVSPDIFGNPATNNYLLNDSYPGKALSIGVIPLFFALFAITLQRRKTIVKYFAIGSCALLLLMIHTPLTENFYRIQLPFFSSSAPTNNIFLLTFMISVLGGIGFDAWIYEKKNLPLILCVGYSLFFFLPMVASLLKIFPVVQKNLLFSSGIWTIGLLSIGAASVKFSTSKKMVSILLLILTVGELFYFFQKFNSFVPSELVYPKTALTDFLQKQRRINRIWGYGSADIESNFATQLNLLSTSGYDPLYPSYYGALINGSKDGKLLRTFSDTTRSDASIANGFGEYDFLSNPYRQKLLSLTGTQFILNRTENATTEKTFPPAKYSIVYAGNNWTVLKTNESLPRAFLTSSYSIAESPESFEQLFFDKSFDSQKTILLSQRIPFSFPPNTASGTAEITSYSPSIVIINTNAPSTSLLFLSDTYYPGWEAMVDNERTPIYKAEWAFRSIVVPAGNHTVTFSYRPKSVYYGAIISVISLFLLSLTLIWSKMKKGIF